LVENHDFLYALVGLYITTPWGNAVANILALISSQPSQMVRYNLMPKYCGKVQPAEYSAPMLQMTDNRQNCNDNS